MATTETNLVLIRHGHSRAQQEDRLAGHHERCQGLSDLGRLQVAALAARAAATGEFAQADVVYTSLSTRAIETRELLAEVLPGSYVAECGWCEAHPGEAEGLAWSEIDARFPRRGTGPDPFERRISGSESWGDLYARVGERLNRVSLEHPGQRVVVVTHGGVVGASFVALGDIPIGKAFAFTAETKNASITEWSHAEDGWRLVRFNDAGHLSQLGV